MKLVEVAAGVVEEHESQLRRTTSPSAFDMPAPATPGRGRSHRQGQVL
jgi:hypothetical protein